MARYQVINKVTIEHYAIVEADSEEQANEYACAGTNVIEYWESDGTVDTRIIKL